jgi:hypothetical protein
MWNARLQKGSAAAHALETNAACARLALACAYSSADEYEAELIQARRKAGAYGSHRRELYAAFVLAMTAIAVGFLAV